MKTLKTISTEKLQSIKNWMQRAIDNAILDDTEKYSIGKKIEELTKEIWNRIQLTLNFEQEPEDWAYAD